MSVIYLDSGRQAWVELCENSVAVTWPGGFKVLSYEDPVADLLGLVRLAVDDLLAARPTKAQTRDARTKVYDEGFDAGWHAYQDAQDRKSSGRRRAMRESHPSAQPQGQTGMVADQGIVAVRGPDTYAANGGV